MGQNKIPEGAQKYYFFVKNKKFKLQLSWYKLFVKKHKIPVETVVECLNEYSKTVNFAHKKNRTELSPQDKVFLLGCVSEYFTEFLKIVAAKTGVEFKKRPSKRRQDSYDAWYEEASMDGSLAYSGVTDDF